VRHPVAYTLATALWLGACGGPFDSEDVVTSVDGDVVCINRPDLDEEFTDCVSVGDIDGDDEFDVGDCVRTRREGESARVMRAEVVPCEIPSTSSG
jgi:hypothetical protein